MSFASSPLLVVEAPNALQPPVIQLAVSTGHYRICLDADSPKFVNSLLVFGGLQG